VYLSYRPDGGEPHRWSLDFGKFLDVEAAAIERVLDMPWDEAIKRLVNGWFEPRKAFVWILLKREQPTLRYGQMKLRVDQIEGGFDDEEIDDLVRTVRTSPQRFADITDDERAQLCEVLGWTEDQFDAELGAGVDSEPGDPKAPETTPTIPLSGGEPAAPTT